VKEATLQAKQSVVADIASKLKKCQSAVLIDYRGLTVEEVTNLRNIFRAQNVEYQVLKNTMISLAADSVGIKGLEPFLSGPTAVAFGVNDAVVPAKIITEFIKNTKKTEIKGGIVSGKVVNAAGVQALAELPPKEVLVAKMLGSMNAPITKLVGVLSNTIRGLMFTINAIAEKKSA
jgi:large subunit ribosomal protein L10